MNYGNQNLRELLAGEYVLGLLRGAARLRFERLMIEDAQLRAEVVSWEEKFAAWNRGLKPQTPSNHVWWKLEARLKAEARTHTNKWAGSRTRSGFLSGAAVVTAVVMLIIGIFIGRSLITTAPTAPSYLAIMSSSKGQPLWLITVHPKTRRIEMKALAVNTPPPGKSYELWMLPGSGKPIAMGLMNSSGVASETVNTEVIAAISQAKGVAISLEPQGGSSTGQPTGPVLYVAPLIST